MSSGFNENTYSSKMNKSIQSLKKDISTLRTGRANPNMLDMIKVDVYGQSMPIEQLATVSVPEARLISIQVWDSGLIKNVENAIIESSLGLNPQSDGALIRLPIPKLSEERRQELSKIASQFSENAKISIRNLRREALDSQKNDKKENNLSEDELKKNSIKIQEITDDFIKKIDQIFENKKADILKV